jgi:hypothetical protein
MKSLYSNRKYCILSNKDKLKPFYKLKKFPIFIGCTDKEEKNDIFCDMDWGVGTKSGLIQLRKLINPNLIYSRYHSEAVGETWREHHERLSKFILNNCTSSIVEMGGGACQLANICVESKKINKWHNVELAKINKLKLNKKIFFTNESITSKRCLKFFKKNTTFVHSHVLEHLYSPLNLLLEITKKTDLENMIFSIPNLRMYLKNKYSNVINFEHTYLLTEEILSSFLKEINFVIKKKEYFKEHSIFIFAKKQKKIKKKIVNLNLKKYQKMYLSMIKYYKNEIVKINFKLKKNNSNFIFGGHIFTQFLLYLGLDRSKILNIIDNSLQKKNLRLYGSNLTVNDPQILRNFEKPTVIVKVGQYQHEVEKQLKAINPKVRIIR